MSKPVEIEKNVDEETGIYPTVSERRGSVSDAIFGDITEEGPNYRAVS